MHSPSGGNYFKSGDLSYVRQSCLTNDFNEPRSGDIAFEIETSQRRMKRYRTESRQSELAAGAIFVTVA